MGCHVDDPSQQRRGEGVRDVVPPPGVVVRTEHSDGVSEHRERYVHSLPRPEINVVQSFHDSGEEGSREREDGVHDRGRVPPSNTSDEDGEDRGPDTAFGRLLHRRPDTPRHEYGYRQVR